MDGALFSSDKSVGLNHFEIRFDPKVYLPPNGISYVLSEIVGENDLVLIDTNQFFLLPSISALTIRYTSSGQVNEHLFGLVRDYMSFLERYVKSGKISTVKPLCDEIKKFSTLLTDGIKCVSLPGEIDNLIGDFLYLKDLIFENAVSVSSSKDFMEFHRRFLASPQSKRRNNLFDKVKSVSDRDLFLYSMALYQNTSGKKCSILSSDSDLLIQTSPFRPTSRKSRRKNGLAELVRVAMPPDVFSATDTYYNIPLLYEKFRPNLENLG